MTVFEPDQRQIIQPSDDEFTDFPFPAVIAVDAQIGNIVLGNEIVTDNFKGSGIAITPSHVLTAAHNLHDEETPGTRVLRARATNSNNQKDLISRTIGNLADPGANVSSTDVNFLANNFTVTNDDNDDIALLRTNLPLLTEDQVR